MALGGMFIDDGRHIRCQHQDGTVIECDLNGQQCTVTNGGPQPGGGANSPDGTGEQNAPDAGGPGFPGLPGEPPPDPLPKLPGGNGKGPTAKTARTQRKRGKPHGRGGKRRPS
jgi:hypothetical protein